VSLEIAISQLRIEELGGMRNNDRELGTLGYYNSGFFPEERFDVPSNP